MNYKSNPLDIWEIDINKTYVIDEDSEVFTSFDAYEDYYFDSITANGVIKCDYETAAENYMENKQVEEISGADAIKRIYEEQEAWLNSLRKRG